MSVIQNKFTISGVAGQAGRSRIKGAHVIFTNSSRMYEGSSAATPKSTSAMTVCGSH